MPKIPKCARYILIAIVVYNLVGDIIHAFCCSFKISTQTNVLAILLVILLIIDGLLTRRNKKKQLEKTRKQTLRNQKKLSKLLCYCERSENKTIVLEEGASQ